MSRSLDRMDPEIRIALAALPSLPVFDLRNITVARETVAKMAEESRAASADISAVTIEIVEASGEDDRPIAIRLFRPISAPVPLPILVWFHGGGQVIGYAAQEDAFLKRLSLEVSCFVAAVDYRLAPETLSPGAAEDGFKA